MGTTFIFMTPSEIRYAVLRSQTHQAVISRMKFNFIDTMTEAIECFQEVLRVQPQFSLARKNLGDAFLQSGRRTEGLTQLGLHTGFVRFGAQNGISMHGRSSVAAN